jgi:hypothetical protein
MQICKLIESRPANEQLTILINDIIEVFYKRILLKNSLKHVHKKKSNELKEKKHPIHAFIFFLVPEFMYSFVALFICSITDFSWGIVNLFNCFHFIY